MKRAPFHPTVRLSLNLIQFNGWWTETDEEVEERSAKDEKRQQKIKAVAERVLERNWNEAFQTIMKLKDSASKYSQLSKLAHDVCTLQLLVFVRSRSLT